jgi:hypothetical protein
MQSLHFALDLEPLEHYFNSFITFQLEQPFNPTINTIGTRMTHPMNPRTPFQWTPFILNKNLKNPKNQKNQRISEEN